MKPNRRNPLFSGFFRGNTLVKAVVITLAGVASLSTAQAAISYWDSNGVTAGAGTAPAGTWGTSTFWSTDSTGATATTAWASGDIATFSAGTDATGAFAVTLSGTQTIGGLTVQEGTPTISGGTALALNSSATPFNITGTAAISSVISGSTFGISKTGSGTLILAGTNTFTGGVTIGAGTVAISAVTGTGAAGGNVAGFGTGTLTVNTGGKPGFTAARLPSEPSPIPSP